MGKYPSLSYLEAISNKYLAMIRGKSPLRKGEKVITAWKFGSQEAHAGQIMLAPKTLPNGNIQKRTITVYAGSNPPVALDTRIYTPNGELLKAYHGIRGESTRAYGNTFEEAKKIIADELKLNPEVKYLYA